ncbi:hypothetical protein TIFTF001_026696 [Ficus carica]|uniref:Uncharacterized protein n=1 Tax=Ficus carica TaxID=3494 RepID=A0AA88DLP5_FICCA|nr:hypothetical protein TIFTF001_026696 [Ficus carica]
MVHKRFSKISFFLGLLFVMHGLNMGSSALHEDKDEIATMSGGRKLMGALKEIVRELGPDNHVINGGISKISGATPSDDDDHKFEGKRGLNGKRKLGDHKSSTAKKMGGFVAFSADYHGPRRHPPKHN